MMAIRSLRDQPVIDEIVLKPTVITKDNYQPFDKALEQRTCRTFEEAAKLGAKIGNGAAAPCGRLHAATWSFHAVCHSRPRP